MKENFDCTQFITYDAEENIDDVINLFHNIGFTIIPYDKIRNVKKEYFKEYFRTNVYELKLYEFLGCFDEWQEVEKTPKIILDFVNILKSIIQCSKVKNLKVILTNFAEEGLSTNEVVKINHKKIVEGLFLMSSKNFEVWTDNLILEIQ
ncbi:hypothetical protein [Clostridium thailandense]|uniref:hypothetical protein n=1 Tax=Clostridium thailandense TaxID=2794346 RepID=UPI0039890C60